MGNVREMKDTCVAYGCFDGVHKGHLAVAKKVVEAAKEKGLTPVIVSCAKEGQVLSTEEEKEYLFKKEGVQEVVTYSGDETAEEVFVKDVLAGTLGAKVIVVGANNANVAKVEEAAKACGAELVVCETVYELEEGKSSIEYDTDIRNIGIKVSTYLAAVTKEMEPDSTEDFSIDEVNPDLPNVVFVWNSQNQGPYSNTFIYGHPIDNMVPTLFHPNELMDGCVVSGNYVWPAFKVPTYLYVNSPILLELYKEHGKTINFRGVIFGRSHNPSNWHKTRCAQVAVKIAQYLDADGLVMAWEGGGNAAVDGMLTIQCAEKHGIKASTITFEFGGVDGTEGILLVDDVPEADAVISGGSIEKPFTIPDVDRVVGGDVFRLNKESGGFFPPSNKELRFEQTTHLYIGGNQAGASTLFAEEY